MRAAHVVRPGSDLPTIAHEGDRVFKYGQQTSGISDQVIVHDAPLDDDDQAWFNACVLTRIPHDGTVYWMLRDG